MKRFYGFALLALVGFNTSSHSQNKSDGIFYSSLNYAVQQGQFDGVATLAEAKAAGDFGVGSQHGLAGELVLLQGKAYRISVDGKAAPMPDSARLPFAAVKFFRAEKQWTLAQPLTLEQLQAHLDSALEPNRFAAIEVTGRFRSVRYKCYYPQQKPYPPIKDVPFKAFDSADINGTMVGFFTPGAALALNNPSYHFHFINSRRTSGGHVDDCLIENVTIKIDYADGLQVKLPSAAQVKNIQPDANKKE